jgi:hypothetical protein
MKWTKITDSKPNSSGQYLVALQDGSHLTAIYVDHYDFFAIPVKGASEENIVAWSPIEQCQFVPSISSEVISHLGSLIALYGKEGLKL